MKRLLILLASLLLCMGCEKHRIIPDDTLALIFHDAFLANSYFDRTNVKRDSLLVYEPIFEKYGYSAEDVQYTIGNFSKRKSARLGDVVELAIDILEEEGIKLDKAVADLDTVRNVATRFARYTYWRDTTIRCTRLKDTTRLKVELDSLRQGNYRIEVTYLIDSLDKNSNNRASIWMEKSGGAKIAAQTITLRRNKEQTYERNISTTDSLPHKLVIDLWEPQKRNDLGRPSITIKELKVTYTLPDDEAIDSLFRSELNLRLFADDFFFTKATDSLTLSADTTRVAR